MWVRFNCRFKNNINESQKSSPVIISSSKISIILETILSNQRIVTSLNQHYINIKYDLSLLNYKQPRKLNLIILEISSYHVGLFYLHWR